MAKKTTKKSSQTITKKASGIIKDNIMASLLVLSLLLNVGLLTSVVLQRSTNKLDESVYQAAYDNLCVKNYTQNLEDRISENGKPAFQKVAFDVYCRTGDFKEVFDQAVTDYYEQAGLVQE